jgi:hypothetical protein
MSDSTLVIDPGSGTQEWKDGNGRLHRLDGPAVRTAFGSEQWFMHGRAHRLDGPAIEWFNGDKEWCIDNTRHRLDGPAIEYASGLKQWWVNGKLLSQTQFDQHPLVVFYRLCKGVA